ncbi:hypothetical protein [Saccharomonospora halophila]|uniref:hypothetical protein n=1 Tax=Saccharomonospora halophila TaxID=129922 RepID=UPI00036B8842|nr:hypothetical protein [Saccharomonospora halophila]
MGYDNEKLAYTGPAVMTIGGVTFGIEWLIITGVVLVIAGVILIRGLGRARKR